MRLWVFAKRNIKELIRDPLTLCFGLGFPLVLLFLLTAIQANIPVEMFELPSLTPGISVFGLAFISLFSASMISKDRSSSFLRRLYTSPMTSRDFILGYTLPLLPFALLQGLVTYVAAIALGLPVTPNIIYALLLLIPASLLYIAMGLLCGSILSEKQVGGICGALLTNLTAWLSGIWFDLELVGGAFKRIAYVLPFVHAVDMEQAALSGDLRGMLPHLWWVLGYAVAILALAIVTFLRQMKKQ